MKKERRRAIHCDLIEPSKTSPGYFKYQITIKEKDGSVNVVPAYGKDMQDAIERLIWNERVDSVTEKKATLPILVTLCLGIIALSGVLSATLNQPIWIVAGMSLVVFAALGINRIESYLNK
jgi:hypothetical protein